MKKILSFAIIFCLCGLLLPQLTLAKTPVKTVYLTFDDGPTGKVNQELLNVLRENHVKATFFVVGKQIQQFPEIMQAIHLDGHSIGLHTHSHNFSKIYRSDDDFMNELKSVEDELLHSFGVDSKIVRFPGGSAGYLDEGLLKKLHNAHYKIFDWSVNLGDGNNSYASPETLVKRATALKNDGDQIILAHCNSNNKNTNLALPTIIKKYRELGYVFRPITTETEEYIFKIRK